MQIVTGGVYKVDDRAITLPPDDDRQFHETRSVIVVSGPETNSDPAWKVVLVCPTSGATSYKTRFCVKLAAGDGNLVKKCWARVPAVQPILKSQLVDHWGVLPEDKLQLIYGRLSEYMGILSDDEPGDEPDVATPGGLEDLDEAPF